MEVLWVLAGVVGTLGLGAWALSEIDTSELEEFRDLQDTHGDRLSTLMEENGIDTDGGISASDLAELIDRLSDETEELETEEVTETPSGSALSIDEDDALDLLERYLNGELELDQLNIGEGTDLATAIEAPNPDLLQWLGTGGPATFLEGLPLSDEMRDQLLGYIQNFQPETESTAGIDLDSAWAQLSQVIARSQEPFDPSTLNALSAFSSDEAWAEVARWVNELGEQPALADLAHQLETTLAPAIEAGGTMSLADFLGLLGQSDMLEGVTEEGLAAAEERFQLFNFQNHGANPWVVRGGDVLASADADWRMGLQEYVEAHRDLPTDTIREFLEQGKPAVDTVVRDYARVGHDDFLIGETIGFTGPGGNENNGGHSNDLLISHNDAMTNGQGGHDMLIGVMEARNLFGQSSNDMIMSTVRDAALHGGGGHDILLASYGPADLYGGQGGDILAASSMGMMHGGTENDLLLVGEQIIADGGDGNDVLIATTNSGIEMMMGHTGRDLLIGSSGNDVIFGGGAPDVIFAGAGDDVIDPSRYGTDEDMIFAGSGDDHVTGLGRDRIWLGAGRDTVAVNLHDPEARDVLTIEDFTPGEDHLLITDQEHGVIDWRTGEAREVASGLELQLGGITILLKGLSLDDIAST